MGQREAGRALLDEGVRRGLSGAVASEPDLNHYGAVAIPERAFQAEGTAYAKTLR